SGDMCLGALVDLGIDLKELEHLLKQAGLTGFRLDAQPVQRQGIGATQVIVEQQELSPPARGLRQIQKIITDSLFPQRVKDLSLQVFQRLAEAEGQVHRIPPEKVHFHEIGAIDAIVDIVGTIYGLELLGIEKIYASALPMGNGPIICQHGILPNPAPATLHLCQGIPLYNAEIEGELVTPTGAALITTLAGQFGHFPEIKVTKVGYGAGSKELPFANVLRLWIGEPTDPERNGQGQLTNDDPTALQINRVIQRMALENDRVNVSSRPRTDKRQPFTDLPNLQVEDVYLLEAAIDDMNPEWYTHLRARLEQAGALDVVFRQVHMKKGRPGLELCVLTGEAVVSKIVQIVLSETTTLGIRLRREKRLSLPRELGELDTPWGPIEVKWAWAPDEQGNWYRRGKLEFESCRRLARKHSLPLPEIYARLINCLPTEISSAQSLPNGLTLGVPLHAEASDSDSAPPED
ncbi:MAG: nickel pincer cofactor biosynthesis protein LarC, partial [Syntrophomonadaceae bacterium]|nr:nickel pincer cofactor biosynthesis protein LarC [Syntrophomonadaceae bacterium]